MKEKPPALIFRALVERLVLGLVGLETVKLDHIRRKMCPPRIGERVTRADIEQHQRRPQQLLLPQQVMMA